MKRNAFFLRGIDIPNNGGVQISYDGEIRLTDGDREDDDLHPEAITKKSALNPHKDLKDLFEGLKPYVAKMYCMTSIDNLRASNNLKPEEQNAFKVLEKKINRMIDSITDKIEVYGMVLKGNDNKRAVVIKAKLTHDNNIKTPITSPRILLSGSEMGCEVEIDEIITKMEDEAYEFIVNQKSQQMDLFASGKAMKVA